MEPSNNRKKVRASKLFLCFLFFILINQEEKIWTAEEKRIFELFEIPEIARDHDIIDHLVFIEEVSQLKAKCKYVFRRTEEKFKKSMAMMIKQTEVYFLFNFQCD